MKTFALYFAHLSETPCNDCSDLPNHNSNPTVTTLTTTAENKKEAYDQLIEQASHMGFEFDDYISFFQEIKPVGSKRIKQLASDLSSFLKELSDADKWSVIVTAINCDLQQDNDGQYVIYTGITD